MFIVSEILGEFRIRGLQIGLYLRNISNGNLGDRYYIRSLRVVLIFDVDAKTKSFGREREREKKKITQ
jgi:hypothetical protein